MGKKWVILLLVPVVLFGALGMAFAVSGYRTQVNTKYGTSYSCSLCHPGGDTNQFNAFADDFSALGLTAALEGLDSDRDGYSNLAEFTARTLPGDAGSIPTVDATAPSVATFSIPATSATLAVAITSLTATDNVGVTGYLVTESAAAPAASAAGWSAAAPANYTFASAGAKTLYAWAKDGANNVSASRSAGVTITLPDTTAPSVATFSIPATATNLVVAITSFTATDNVGVTGYLVTESAAAPAASAAGWSASAPASYTFASAGQKTLYAWAKDGANNVSASRSAGVTITLPDTTAPSVATFSIPATATNLVVAITSFTATDNVGVTGYLVTESAAAPAASAAGWSPSAPASYSFASAGAKTLYAWAKDGANNVSTSRSANVTITLPDAAAPSVATFSIPATATNLVVAITSFTATDNMGVAGYLVTESAAAPAASAAGWSANAPASYTFASAGAKTLYAWAKDGANNVSTSRSANVTITLPDAAAPSVATFSIPATSTTLAVAISSLTATDNVGVTGYLVTESAAAPAASAAGWSPSAPASYTFASAGTKTLYAWAKDGANNVSASRSAGVTITLPDTAAPSVATFTIPATATNLVVAITSFTATDNMGVTGYLVTESAAAPAASAAGWSAAAPASYSFASAGAKTLYAWAKDGANNVSAGRSANVTITLPDAAAPSVATFSIPATSTTLAVAISSLTATDNVGVTGYLVTESAAAPAASAAGWSPSAPASYTFASAGAKTLYAWAKDGANNVSASRSASVTITLPDTAAPSVATFSVPATATNLVVAITSFTAADNVGVAGYLVTESAAAPAAAAAGWSAAAPANYSFASAGQKTLYAWAKDGANNVSASRSANVIITLPANSPAILGLFNNGKWYWDDNGNLTLEDCGTDACIPAFGGFPGDLPITGDWTGDGIKKVGIYRQGYWYLDKNGNEVWDGCEVDGCLGPFGGYAGDIPIVGDWTGDGIAKIGIYRQGNWYLDENGNGAWDGCGLDGCLGPYGGAATDIPIVGDWAGDGIAKIGIYRQGNWYLDKNGNKTWDGCEADSCLGIYGGAATDIPIVGDWTGDGIAKIGIYRQGNWYLDENGNGAWDDCGGDICVSTFGVSGDVPITK